MTSAELRREIASLLDLLPDAKLAEVFDFVQFLAEREAQSAWLKAQGESNAYREWVSDDEDVYDEVFADASPAR
jgi:uncharacterized protein YehS (DUF1456 family)